MAGLAGRLAGWACLGLAGLPGPGWAWLAGWLGCLGIAGLAGPGWAWLGLAGLAGLDNEVTKTYEK